MRSSSSFESTLYLAASQNQDNQTGTGPPPRSRTWCGRARKPPTPTLTSPLPSRGGESPLLLLRRIGSRGRAAAQPARPQGVGDERNKEEDE